MARGRPNTKDESLETPSYLDKISSETKSNQSRLSLVLGALIVLVVGILIFNYFNKPKPEVGPAQQTQAEEDVSPDKLPGKYTVKEGDTLFLVAEKYYKDGYKYEEIVKANNLANADAIEKDQVLKIPKLEEAVAQVLPSPEASPQPQAMEEELGTGGADTTIWGPKIEGDSYTVVEGDWLSKIAGRAYGDIFAYNKIAQANNIPNPDLIQPGQILKIPR
ncbi:MAG: hypothetical protein G01um10147_1173 [Microgenomates group bacterium Gr01-1014_7]|nr:MAG: hypothetical protein G01um10147_1173 [Microgenomates group bacterium Gr01-1014_7]